MFKKSIIAAATVAIMAGSLGGMTTTASAGWHPDRVRVVKVCKPVFDWKWVYRHYEWKRIKVKVGERCDWVQVRNHHRRHHHYGY
jgi:hypothetical protein